MTEERRLPVPRTATDVYLAAIFGRLGEVLDRLPEPAPPPGDVPGGEVEIREPGVVVSPVAPVPGAPPAEPEPAEPDPEPEPEREEPPPAQPEPVEEPTASPAPPEPEQEPEPEPGNGEEGPEDFPGEPTHPGADAAHRPATRDPKQAWIDYAVERGLTEDDVRGMTKQQLIDLLRD